ncbi:unnamed protein product [Prorocentrum cordatum]|uniref:Uncharacterized protein n=1 Tax=Prorocentrum cordatum TaxID=2364126 RepID=A0ABN9UJB0_9DINO|nr:unnamed protein product [Polarella glacialis]
MAAGSPKRRPGAAEAEAEEEDDNDDDGGGAGRWRRTLGRLPLQRRRGAPPPARGRQAWRAGARAPVAVAWACAALAALAGVGCRAPWATAAVAGLRPVFAMSRYDILRSKSALEIDLGAVQRKFIRYDVDAFNQDAAAIEERAQLRKRMEKLPEFGMLLRANDARLEQSSGGHEDRLSWAMHEQGPRLQVKGCGPEPRFRVLRVEPQVHYVQPVQALLDAMEDGSIFLANNRFNPVEDEAELRRARREQLIADNPELKALIEKRMARKKKETGTYRGKPGHPKKKR